MSNRIKTVLRWLLCAVAVFAWPVMAQDVLPRPEPGFKGKIGRTAKGSVPDFPKAVEAPKGAPNVLLILTDDVGFGASSTLGGPIQTPNFRSEEHTSELQSLRHLVCRLLL